MCVHSPRAGVQSKHPTARIIHQGTSRKIPSHVANAMYGMSRHLLCVPQVKMKAMIAVRAASQNLTTTARCSILDRSSNGSTARVWSSSQPVHPRRCSRSMEQDPLSSSAVEDLHCRLSRKRRSTVSRGVGMAGCCSPAGHRARSDLDGGAPDNRPANIDKVQVACKYVYGSRSSKACLI